YHSCEAYIARLLARGYKVAICEQTEDPKLAKGLVRRDVVRVITPGTVTESSMLREELSNYLAAVCMAGERGAAAFCDVTTGEFKIASFTSEAAVHISNQLAAFAPREAVLSGEALALGRMCAFLRENLHCVIE